MVDRERLIDPWETSDEFLMAYEWYAAGETEEAPDITLVPEHQRASALDYARFLDWKYSDGLWESMHRKPSDPDFFRSQFRLIQGGGEDLPQPPPS